MKQIIILSLLLPAFSLFAQIKLSDELTLNGFIDAYYSYDFGVDQGHEKAAYIFNHKKHDNFSINLAVLGLQYENEQVYGKLSLMTGDYAQYNLAGEPGILQSLYEGYLGYHISDKWRAEAGVYGSHISYESAISSQNINLTRSLNSESTPYYQAGARVYFTPSEKWELMATVSNGIQNIQESAQDDSKAVGWQVQFTPDSSLTINSSWILSREYLSPTYGHATILIQNFYLDKRFTKTHLIAGVDFGIRNMQSYPNLSGAYVNPYLVGNYAFTEKIKLGARVEYIYDEAVVLPYPITDLELEMMPLKPENYEIGSVSLNLDLALSENLLFRIEGRNFWHNENVDVNDSNTEQSQFVITTSAALTF